LIPILNPQPVSAHVELGLLKAYALADESSIQPRIALGAFVLDPIYVAPSMEKVLFNSSLTLFEPNFAWINYYFRQGVKHGFLPTRFLL
jgi:hypothetical protein